MIGCTLITCIQKLGSDAATLKKAGELLEKCVPLLVWWRRWEICGQAPCVAVACRT
jgi:hypothetical protein